MKINLDKAFDVKIELPKLVSDCTECLPECDRDCGGTACIGYTPMKIRLLHRHDLGITFTEINCDCGGEFGDSADKFTIEIDGKKIELEQTI